MATVQYHFLGKSGLKVSVPILGAMSFGSPNGLYVIVSYPQLVNHILNILQPWVLDEEPSIEIMKAARDLSVNTIDTANITQMIHRFDPSVTPQETMKALHDLVQSGKVHYIGASFMCCWQFAMLNDVAARNGWTTFISMQDEYLLLYREEFSITSRNARCLLIANNTVSVSSPS
ncbi:NADP-dependent oxidoreductase domain-containing protein [Suillus discolor]|uniref:NADP-dependent oxidoreductase domain-containing protein n=1 Tax=Suillus discolor TaxID=1912936 RepID=A0A9P7EVN7_9AGAM|nr:NADP-dependent oxidoreductase domain-containing protein [Suillus discolor]KAG2093728.1 NADP-dependent oxidoreductase domain-containing protein [Suillus discolor]